MDKELFGLTWDFDMTEIKNVGFLTHYKNSKLGKFYITSNAERKLESLPNNTYIFLSRIFETKFTDKTLLICLEEEKKSIAFEITIKLTIEEIISKFPKNILGVCRTFFT